MAQDPGATHDAALATLEHHFQAMPPVAALQIAVDGFDGDCLRLSAPLAVHVNDKGCAFGGSLVFAMTLASLGHGDLAAGGGRPRRRGVRGRERYAFPLAAVRRPARRGATGRSGRLGGFRCPAARSRARRPSLAACVRLPDGGSRRRASRATSPSPEVRMRRGPACEVG